MRLLSRHGMGLIPLWAEARRSKDRLGAQAAARRVDRTATAVAKLIRQLLMGSLLDSFRAC
jgi:hypothetical protein